jgi:hypothetical protein
MGQQFVKTWNSDSSRNEARSLTNGFQIVGREIRLLGDGQAIVIDAVSGITIIGGGLPDRFLAQITAANKVAGSAVQLAASGGLKDNSGLEISVDSAMFTLDSVSGVMLNYNPAEFQFIPGTGLVLHAVPDSALSANIMYIDGSREFTGTVGGIDAVVGTDFPTLDQVNTLIANAVTGDFTETIINLAGQTVYRGWSGYVEGVSGSFRLAKADSPTNCPKLQYVCVATTSIADGASGSFQNPSVEVNNVNSIVSGFNGGDTLYLSTTAWGQYQNTAPSVSGETIYPAGWVKPNKLGFVFFPGEALDL